MALTRYKDERAGYDGPVSGAIVPLIVTMGGTYIGAATDSFKIDLPAGMRFRVTDATFRADAVAGAPTISLGTINNATALVAATVVTSNLGSLTVKTASQNIVAGGVLVATLTIASATGNVRSGVLTIVGHVSAPPTSVIVRNASHY